MIARGVPLVIRRPSWLLDEREPGIKILRLAAIAAVSGCGLVAIAVAATIARGGSKWAEPVFWAGMFTLWLPSSVRIVGRRATRSERIALLAMLSLGLYGVSILQSPRYFTNFDAFNHWRAAQDMMRTGSLFSPNPALPIISHYPGLEIVTTALTNLTGLSTVVTGRLVIGVARVVMIIALYLLYERVGRSIWLASVAALVYCTNPQFLFFDSSYGYESLAIPLAVLALYAVARAWVPAARDVASAASPPVSTVPHPERARLTILVMLGLAATVVTHHITSYALALTLVMLAVLSYATTVVRGRWWLWAVALAGVGLVLLWLYPFADQMVTYLGPPVTGGLHQVISLVSGGGITRPLFQSYVGPPTPAGERAASYAFAGVTVLAALVGALRLLRTRPFEAFTLLFMLGALLYPVTDLFHFTTNAVLGSRATAFIFVPVAFCVAMAATLGQMRRPSPGSTRVLVLVGALLLYGGVTLGAPPWNRLPGPYLVSADDRSVELEGMSAASWAGGFLPRNSRIAADRVNSELMMTYGHQWPVLISGHEGRLVPILLRSRLTPPDRTVIRDAGLQYIVGDYRLTHALPWLGFYYYQLGESNAPTYRRPIPGSAIAKFDRAPGVSRVFDSGNIVIFDVGGLGRHG